jgi:hypothetical protein
LDVETVIRPGNSSQAIVQKGVTVRACRISSSAKHWIESQAPAKVLHVFPKACNLINNDGEVLSVVASDIGAGPFSIVLRPDTNGVTGFKGFSNWVYAASPIQTETHTIYLGDLQVDTREAEVWNPAPNWPSIRRSRDRWLGFLPTLKKTMDGEAPPESLYRILDAILSGDSGGLSEDTTIDIVQNHVRGLGRTLCEGILTESEAKIREGAMGLAGLGGGLTPAGDDFIMGALLGLRSIVFSESFSRIAETILSIVIPRTNSLSAAWLQAAAVGEAHETWRLFFEAMEQGSREKMEAAAIKILDAGHSSGADAIAGFLAVNLMDPEIPPGWL